MKSADPVRGNQGVWGFPSLIPPQLGLKIEKFRGGGGRSTPTPSKNQLLKGKRLKAISAPNFLQICFRMTSKIIRIACNAQQKTLLINNYRDSSFLQPLSQFLVIFVIWYMIKVKQKLNKMHASWDKEDNALSNGISILKN